jgi:hypothetical protein
MPVSGPRGHAILLICTLWQLRVGSAERKEDLYSQTMKTIQKRLSWFYSIARTPKTDVSSCPSSVEPAELPTYSDAGSVALSLSLDASSIII